MINVSAMPRIMLVEQMVSYSGFCTPNYAYHLFRMKWKCPVW
jgi:hypothetical protein